MKNKRLLFCLILSVLLLFSMSALTVHAHPGGTDTNGGHKDRSSGEYHYHHGYEAHDHYDIDGDGDVDCPLDLDDHTRTNSANPPKQPSSSGLYSNITPPSFPTLPIIDKAQPTETSIKADETSRFTRQNTSFNIGYFYFTCSFASVFIMIALYHLFDYFKPRSEKIAKLILNIWSAIGLIFLLTTLIFVFPYAKWFDKKKAK